MHSKSSSRHTHNSSLLTIAVLLSRRSNRCIFCLRLGGGHKSARINASRWDHLMLRTRTPHLISTTRAVMSSRRRSDSWSHRLLALHKRVGLVYSVERDCMMPCVHGHNVCDGCMRVRAVGRLLDQARHHVLHKPNGTVCLSLSHMRLNHDHQKGDSPRLKNPKRHQRREPKICIFSESEFLSTKKQYGRTCQWA